MHTDLPRTLQEAIIYFADPDNCHSFLVAIRWPNGVKCPHCGSSRITWLANQQRWKCRQEHPRRQFSVRVGTIFEESPLGLDKWLAAVWMTVNAKNGISSYEVHRALGVTQKTAWFMGHRIRMALHAGSFKRLLEGDVKGTWLAERSLKPGGIAVVISQSVEGQAPHYLVGRFGTDYGGPLWQRTVQPRVAQASRILVCSAYQSRVDLDSYGPPDRVVPCADWNEVSSHLHAAYPQGGKAAVYPCAAIQLPA